MTIIFHFNRQINSGHGRSTKTTLNGQDPLMIPDGALVLDTTALDAKEVARRIIERVRSAERT